MADHMNHAAVAKLEPYLLMSKSAKGAAATKLIQDATAAPGVFVFAELLEKPSVHELAGQPQHAQWYKLLELFCYGTYGDYKRKTSEFPTLSPPQVIKLKYLTLATLAKSSRILSYANLLSELDIATIRELEDLIIDAIYQDVVRGKLDQRDRTFEVEWSMGRDVREDELRGILQALTSWAQSTSTVLEALDKKISKVKDEEKVHKKMLEDHDKMFNDNLKEAYAKAKDAQPTNTGGRKNRQGGGSGRDDAMDLDDPSEIHSHNSSIFSALRGKKKNSMDTEPKPVRKRGRDT